MYILLFTIGLIVGFLLKISYDKYFEFRTRELQTIAKMEDILTNFKALEKIKDFNSDSAAK